MAQNQIDGVLAALYVAAEDDAVATKSTVDLPVYSYSKRLDGMITQLRYNLESGDHEFIDKRDALQYAAAFLFGTLGYKVAEKPLELYSPYRIYMHKVLSQRCGTPEALALLLCTFIQRCQSAGLLPNAPIEMGLRGPGVLPCLRITGDDTGLANTRWITAREGVTLCLEALKRSNWSWHWDVHAPDCFMPPAQAFLGAFGRANTGSSVVGVMQATGRPFGDLDMALLATERLAQAAGGLKGGYESARHVRDCGVLLCHMKRYSEAKTALSLYQEWLQEVDRRAPVPDTVTMLKEGAKSASPSPEEADTVDKLLMKLNQLTLEDVYQAS